MNLHYDRVRYKNKHYAVINIKYQGINLPVLIDWQDINTIKNLKKRWRVNKFGFVSCNYTYDGIDKEVFLHELIMGLKMYDNEDKILEKPIVHLNKINLDNRRDNLMYDTTDKELHKNLVKKRRTIKLPTNSGIKTEEIPTYVWYMKPNGSHGERFMVQVDDIKWKTTSSKKLSLRYKLEEAKKYLRELRKERPELFEEYSMNGDFTKEGGNLMDSYYSIVEKAGYDHIQRKIPEKCTNRLLRQGKPSRKEQQILRSQNNLIGGSERKRRIMSNLPKDCGVSIQEIPKYCYYRPVYRNRGDYFVIENHPNQEQKIWQTTSSKKLTTLEKFDQLLDRLEELEA